MKAASISRESLLEKGIHFLGLGSDLSGWTAVDAKGLRLGSYGQSVSFHQTMMSNASMNTKSSGLLSRLLYGFAYLRLQHGTTARSAVGSPADTASGSAYAAD
jgi:hypothetical protein